MEEEAGNEQPASSFLQEVFAVDEEEVVLDGVGLHDNIDHISGEGQKNDIPFNVAVFTDGSAGGAHHRMQERFEHLCKQRRRTKHEVECFMNGFDTATNHDHDTAADAGAIVVLRGSHVALSDPAQQADDIVLCQVSVPVHIHNSSQWFRGAEAFTIGAAEISGLCFALECVRDMVLNRCSIGHVSVFYDSTYAARGVMGTLACSGNLSLISVCRKVLVECMRLCPVSSCHVKSHKSFRWNEGADELANEA
eukprot:8521572-Karenia_brevis.AAC.1